MTRVPHLALASFGEMNAISHLLGSRAFLSASDHFNGYAEEVKRLSLGHFSGSSVRK